MVKGSPAGFADAALEDFAAGAAVADFGGAFFAMGAEVCDGAGLAGVCASAADVISINAGIGKQITITDEQITRLNSLISKPPGKIATGYYV
jgi:hypothetical protein